MRKWPTYMYRLTIISKMVSLSFLTENRIKFNVLNIIFTKFWLTSLGCTWTQVSFSSKNRVDYQDEQNWICRHPTKTFSSYGIVSSWKGDRFGINYPNCRWFSLDLELSISLAHLLRTTLTFCWSIRHLSLLTIIIP